MEGMDRFFSPKLVGCPHCGLTTEMPTPAEKMVIGFYVVTCDHCGQECRYAVRGSWMGGGTKEFASTRAILINPGSTATPLAETPIPPVRKKNRPKSRTPKSRTTIGRGERWANKLEWSNPDAKRWASALYEAAHNARILARLGYPEMMMVAFILRCMANVVFAEQPTKLPPTFIGFANSAREEFLEICNSEEAKMNASEKAEADGDSGEDDASEDE